MTKYLFAIFILFSISLNAADSTLVRVKVDVDSIQLSINDELTTTDLYGNLLIKDAWFIISLDSGDYNILLELNDSVLTDTLINIVDQEIITLEYKFLQSKISQDTIDILDSIIEKVNVTIDSDPDNASVIIDGDSTFQSTPLLVQLPVDSIKIEVYKENYQPLVSTLLLELNRDINANFILRTFSPPGIVPESLGLSYLPILNMKDTLSVKKISNTFNSIKETFFIFPFLQGLIMKLVVSDENQKDADIMILSGVGLTLGTYLIGKIVVKKKYNDIIKWNEQLELNNIAALEHNAEVDSIVRVNNEQKIRNWERENSNRGKVEITEVE